jgi:6-phosphogluconolactonase (cycloisomerase 2 family)
LIQQKENNDMAQSNHSRSIVFVSLTGDEQIKLYDLDPQSGALKVRTVSKAHGPSGALWLHPNGKVLYDAHVESTTLASFRFDAASGPRAS